jgi:hypothetical protein
VRPREMRGRGGAACDPAKCEGEEERFGDDQGFRSYDAAIGPAPA